LHNTLPNKTVQIRLGKQAPKANKISEQVKLATGWQVITHSPTTCLKWHKTVAKIHPPIPATLWFREHPAHRHSHGWPTSPVEDALESFSHFSSQKARHIPQGKMKITCFIPTADFYVKISHEIIPQCYGYWLPFNRLKWKIPEETSAFKGKFHQTREQLVMAQRSRPHQWIGYTNAVPRRHF
jgi:hypothetical protein